MGDISNEKYNTFFNIENRSKRNRSNDITPSTSPHTTKLRRNLFSSPTSFDFFADNREKLDDVKLLYDSLKKKDKRKGKSSKKRHSPFIHKNNDNLKSNHLNHMQNYKNINKRNDNENYNVDDEEEIIVSTSSPLASSYLNRNHRYSFAASEQF